MNHARTGRTIVLGLGNPILGDDRVGLAVAEEVGRLIAERPLPGVDVAVGWRGGFELLDALNGYRRAILVDCLAVADPAPGRVRCMDASRTGGSARLVGAHELSLAGIFALARRLDIEMPAEVAVFGVEGAELAAFSEEMTPEVSAAAATLARRIYDSLAGARSTERDTLSQTDV